jgi:hypothetical protein
MKKIFTLIVLLNVLCFSQTLVNSYPFPQFTHYNYFWGITEKDNTFWITTTYYPTLGTFPRMYQVSKTGEILDSISGPVQSNAGIAWDGNNFWLSERTRSSSLGSPRIYKLNSQGALVDSFMVPQPVTSIGDVAVEGNKLWYTLYQIDNPVYPHNWAFAFDVNTKQIVDSIPLRSLQPIGIAIKGDTIFYSTNSPDAERIVAYSRAVGDTIFSFPAPDPDGTCNPRGLHWDGSYLYLIAERVGGSTWVYRTLYQYSITGGGNPAISLNTNEFDFGNVIIGQSVTDTLTISNTGNEDLYINQFEISNNAYSIESPLLPDTIKPGSIKYYAVTFTPAQFDSANGTLKVHSNDVTAGVKTIRLRGKGIHNGSFLYSSAQSFNYGIRRKDSKCGFIFTLENRGNLNLEISSAVFSDPAFTFDTVGVSLPVIIVPQASRDFRVWFTPVNTSTFEDTLKIVTNSVNIPLLKIFLSGIGQDVKYVMGDIFWESNIPFNPYSYTNDYQIASMKRLPDVNGDGVDEVVASSKNYLVTCFNGNSSVTGDILWTFNTGINNNNTGSVMFEDALHVRTDVDGDGINDVVFGCGGGNEFVYTISGRTGKLIWAYGDSINYSRGDINGIRADKDFNNDGINDVLVSASGSSGGGRHAAICLNGVDGTEIFNVVQNASYTFDITSTSYGGIIVVDLGNGGPYYLNGFSNTGLLTWAAPVPEVVWSLREVKDLNNDGIKDFVGYCGGMNVNVFARDGANGAQIWNAHYPNYSTFSNIKIISDLDSNGYQDMVFSGKEGVFRHDTKTGNVIWSNTLDNSYVFGVEELGDLNSDGINEIAAGTMNSKLYILNGRNGDILFQYSFGTPVTSGVERVINSGNIDDNYSTDFTAGTKNGRVVAFSGGIAGPLPVEMLSFSCEAEGSSILLKWFTASEKNNMGFRILLNNTEVSFVEGKGTTTEISSYSAALDNIRDGKYFVSVIQVDYDGTKTTIAETEVEVNSVPANFALYQNYPNPFNPNTIIKFDIPFESNVELKVYDLLGTEVMSLFKGEHKGGTEEIEFNASALSSGVYMYRINAYRDGSMVYSQSRKMIVLK